MKGDDEAARAALSVARAQQEAAICAHSDGTSLSRLGLIDAGLGRKGEVLHEGGWAVELTPVAKDSTLAPKVTSNLALIYVWTSERNLAIEQLEIAAKLLSSLDYGDLRLDPRLGSLAAIRALRKSSPPSRQRTCIKKSVRINNGS